MVKRNGTKQRSTEAHRHRGTKIQRKSWVKISQVRTLSIKRLGEKIGKAAGKELELVVEGLTEIILG